MLCGKDYIGHDWKFDSTLVHAIWMHCQRCSVSQVFRYRNPASILNGKAIDPRLVVQAGDVI